MNNKRNDDVMENDEKEKVMIKTVILTMTVKLRRGFSSFLNDRNLHIFSFTLKFNSKSIFTTRFVKLMNVFPHVG